MKKDQPDLPKKGWRGESLWLSKDNPAQEGGVKLQGLHMDYSHDFVTRNMGISVPALSSTAVPDLLEAMDRLRISLLSCSSRSRGPY